MFLFFIIVLLTCVLIFLGCFRQKDISHDFAEVSEGVLIDPLFELAFEIVSSLDDSILAAQVIISGIDGRGALPGYFKPFLEDVPAGGVMLFRYNLDTPNNAIHSLISETVALINEVSGISPFVAVDHEGGSVNRFNRGVADLHPASYYWEYFENEGKEAALEKIEKDSLKAAAAINNFGVNLNFAPIAEFLTDDNRVFLKSRSYGPDPLFTAEASHAFIRGMESAGVLCVVKHFPGSAGSDPHYSLSVIDKDREALEELTFPFKYLIKKNSARAIMAAHSLVPVMDDKIASLSSVIMQNWLRDDLGFSGIIISDDFFMAAAGNIKPETAAVQSVAAGADMILVWPRDLRNTHKALLSALETGELSRERLTEAVTRIIYEKLRMGIYMSL